MSSNADFYKGLIICPFLTSLVPKEVYERYITLIIHPGPPGDVGPSALDWVLMGDDGSVNESSQLLHSLDRDECRSGRSHWGVTVLQAIEEFDAGPVWAFDQFPINIDSPGLTKSDLYRGPVTIAAVSATLAAISRIQIASANDPDSIEDKKAFSPLLKANPAYGRLAVSDNLPFQGGRLHHRPLLKAGQRDFDVRRHTARQIARRICCSDSQPGALSKIFGPNLYVYGGIVEDNISGRQPASVSGRDVMILGIRQEAVCVPTCDGKGIWITHIRRPKSKSDTSLWPKVPAVSGLLDLKILTPHDELQLAWATPADWSLCPYSTFQDVWIEMQPRDTSTKTAYLYFSFYNGAMSTKQCSRLIDAMQYLLSQSTPESRIDAVVLMGGPYFSNGIALNVIEASADPAKESWLNINRIDDVCHYILHEFPSRNILTIAAIRGNAAAGGVALATACDIVIAGSGVVLNPSYRAIGLSGSEGHTLSYYGRCGQAKADKILRDMMPLSANQAQSMGLVDFVFPGTGAVLEDYIKTHVSFMLHPGIIKSGSWKSKIDLSTAALARARANELAEMGLDFWSARSVRYHERRFAFVRKVKPTQTPLRFATHRRLDANHQDEEETDSFDDVSHYRALAETKLVAEWRQRMRIPDVPLQPPAPEVTAVPDATRGQSLFSCYYNNPPTAEVPSPPMTPWQHSGTVVIASHNIDERITAKVGSKDLSTSKGMSTPPMTPLNTVREVGTISYF